MRANELVLAVQIKPISESHRLVSRITNEMPLYTHNTP